MGGREGLRLALDEPDGNAAAREKVRRLATRKPRPDDGDFFLHFSSVFSVLALYAFEC